MWQSQALCRTRPFDWWDSGDPGNRLAMMLCQRACPVRRECADADPAPAGVIRAGVAYSDAGSPLKACPCGYPVAGRGPFAKRCIACSPPESMPMFRPRPSDDLLSAARKAKAELLAQGQTISSRSLSTVLRARGHRLRTSTSNALARQMREEGLEVAA